MEIITLTPDDLRKDNKLLHRIAQELFDTFQEIKDLYRDNETWKNEMSSLENTKIKLIKGDLNFKYYICMKSTQQIAGILLGKISHGVYLNPDRGTGSIYFSGYMSVNKQFRQQGIASTLKNYFEEEARKHQQETGNTTIVASVVKKENLSSVKRNEKNGYNKYEHGEDDSYFQFVKKIG